MAESQASYDQDISFDTFRPEDAPAVVQLFKTVYGDSYPVKLVYDAEGLIRAFREGSNIPGVGRSRSGQTVGYCAYYRSAPSPKVYEAGQGLVLPAFRNQGVAKKILAYLHGMAPRLDAEAVFGEAVCNHTYMQAAARQELHYAEVALEVDLMPAEAYTVERSATGRVAGLLMFRLLEERRQIVYLPECYEQQLRYMYGGLTTQPEFGRGRAPLSSAATDMAVQVFDFAKVARLAVHHAGADFDRVMGAKEDDLEARGVRVFQVWVKLSWPFIDEVVAVLRKRKYFLGGPLPRWFGEDGLLMQKVSGRPNWEGIKLDSDRAEKIREMVKADWVDREAIKK